MREPAFLGSLDKRFKRRESSGVASNEADTTPSAAEQRRVRWGQRLAAAIRQRDMSVSALHRALIRAGADVSLPAVYGWLSGEWAPTAEHQAVIARVLDVPAHELFPVDIDGFEDVA